MRRYLGCALGDDVQFNDWGFPDFTDPALYDQGGDSVSTDLYPSDPFSSSAPLSIDPNYSDFSTAFPNIGSGSYAGSGSGGFGSILSGFGSLLSAIFKPSGAAAAPAPYVPQQTAAQQPVPGGQDYQSQTQGAAPGASESGGIAVWFSNPANIPVIAIGAVVLGVAVASGGGRR